MTEHGDDSTYRRSPLIRKIAWTVLAALVVYAGTEFANPALDISRADQLLLSILTGGVALLIQYLAEFEQRLFAFEHDQRLGLSALDSAMQRALTGINEATELHEEIGNSALDRTILKQVIRYAGNFTDMTTPLVRRLANSETERLAGTLRALSSDRELFYEGEDREYLLALTRQARKSILAASWPIANGMDAAFWSTDLACRYLDLQSAAVDRGVTIKRLFVFDPADLTTTAEVQQILALHRNSGIETKVLGAAPTDRSVMNFALFDNEVIYDTSPVNRSNASGELTSHLIFDQAVVQSRTLRFEKLWKSGSESLLHRNSLP